MSRTPSSVSAGVQVASGTSSTIYTLLLIIATAALIATAVYLSVVMDARYGFSVPFGNAYETAKAKPANELKVIDDQERIIRDALSSLGQSGSAGQEAGAAQGTTNAVPTPPAGEPAAPPAAQP